MSVIDHYYLNMWGKQTQGLFWWCEASSPDGLVPWSWLPQSASLQGPPSWAAPRILKDERSFAPVPLQPIFALLDHCPEISMVVHPLQIVDVIKQSLLFFFKKSLTNRHKALLKASRSKLFGVSGKADQVEISGLQRKWVEICIKSLWI